MYSKFPPPLVNKIDSCIFFSSLKTPELRLRLVASFTYFIKDWLHTISILYFVNILTLTLAVENIIFIEIRFHFWKR